MAIDRDAVLEISVSDDGMTAYGTFLPPIGEGLPMTPDYVDSVLESAGVVAGIQTDGVAEAMFACNTDRRLQKDVVVARGEEPHPARPSFWDVTVATVRGGPEAVSDADRVDYKGETRFQVVYQGDKVAFLVPSSDGIPGLNVYGQEIQFETERVPAYQPGEGTRIDDDFVVAAVGGQLVITETEFRVEDRLEIFGDVGYGTGSIEFPGDVSVKGEIKEGFHIWAGGNITADRTVDVSEIYCRGGFTGAGGLIGRGKALLRAGDTVSVRFIGNCFVESKASVLVKQYVYHARVGCLGTFTMGKGGRVIGGIITAARGVSCGTLGNAAGIPTLVRCGTNFIVERKLRLNRENHEKITLRLQKLVEKLGENPTHRQLDILRQLEEEQDKYAQALGELTEGLDVADDATITVTEAVHPGVRIQIGRAEYIVRDTVKSVVFHLDKASGQIVTTKIERATR